MIRVLAAVALLACAGVVYAGFGSAQGGVGGGFSPAKGSSASVTTGAQLIPGATAGATIIYVSSSTGDDTNAGTEGAPLKTVSAAMSAIVDQAETRVRFLRGDVWHETIDLKKRGLSAARPIVFEAYGSGDRPQFRTGSSGGINCTGSGGTPDVVAYVAFQDLDFYASTRDTGSPDYVDATGSPGLFWLQGVNYLVFERVSFRFYETGSLQDFGDNGFVGTIYFRDCDWLDSYDTTAHSQGLYLEPSDSASFSKITFDGCVFDHNGWLADANKTIFNHNLYVQTSDAMAAVSGGLTVKNCVFLRGSSHGIQARSGGVIQDNVFIQNAIAILVGGGEPPVSGGLTATVSGNVILEGTDITASNPRGQGILLENISSATVSNNRLANNGAYPTGPNGAAIWGGGASSATLSANVAYEWVDTVPEATEQLSNTTGYTDPTRDLASFDAAQGGPGTEANAIAHIRARSVGYSQAALLAYFRAGLQ